MKQVITKSFSETQKQGFDLSKTIKGGAVICLYGNLGSGKTTFVQGFAKGLGITRNIISPTFIIMRTYDIENKRNALEVKKLYHVDLYRIETDADIDGLGLVEIMNDTEAIVLIEWPDKIEHRLPDNRKNIYFTYLEDDTRQITLA